MAIVQVIFFRRWQPFWKSTQQPVPSQYFCAVSDFWQCELSMVNTEPEGWVQSDAVMMGEVTSLSFNFVNALSQEASNLGKPLVFLFMLVKRAVISSSCLIKRLNNWRSPRKLQGLVILNGVGQALTTFFRPSSTRTPCIPTLSPNNSVFSRISSCFPSPMLSSFSQERERSVRRWRMCSTREFQNIVYMNDPRIVWAVIENWINQQLKACRRVS